MTLVGQLQGVVDPPLSRLLWSYVRVLPPLAHTFERSRSLGTMHGLLQRALLILNSPQFLDSPVGKEAVQLMSDLRELYPPATDWPLQRYGPSSFVDAMEQEQFDREAVEGPFTAFHVRLYEHARLSDSPHQRMEHYRPACEPSPLSAVLRAEGEHLPDI